MGAFRPFPARTTGGLRTDHIALHDRHDTAVAAASVAATGNPESAFRILLDIEEPAFQATTLLNAIAAVVMVPIGSLLTLAGLFVPLVQGNPRTFQVISKTRGGSAREDQLIP